VNALQARHGISVEWTPCEEPDVQVGVKEAVYRIVREAMHNVVKHAQAHTVSVVLEVNGDHIRFEVRDDGAGFDLAADKPGHLGLRSMRERAERLRGRVTLHSEPQKGTRVEGIVPL
jgi:signal transduction histidine kinase